jgi:hypothetical protein
MPKAAKNRTNSARRPLRVGDRIRLRIVARTLVGSVVEDRGHIGIDGGQVVHVSVRGMDGEVENMDWPADELTIVRRGPSRK